MSSENKKREFIVPKPIGEVAKKRMGLIQSIIEGKYKISETNSSFFQLFGDSELAKMVNIEGIENQRKKGIVPQSDLDILETLLINAQKSETTSLIQKIKKTLKEANMNNEKKIFYVDAAKTGANSMEGEYLGKTQWQGGFVENEKFIPSISSCHEYEMGHNNAAEYIAIVDAFRALKFGAIKFDLIYSDSITAIAWIRNQKTNCSIRYKLGKDFRNYFEACENWVKNNSDFVKQNYDKLHQWVKDENGGKEIPADYGNK